MQKSEHKRSLGRPMRIQEDNIKMEFQEIGWKSADKVILPSEKDHWQIQIH